MKQLKRSIAIAALSAAAVGLYGCSDEVSGQYGPGNLVQCGDNICTESQVCIDGNCVESEDLCGSSYCSNNQVCVDNECVDKDGLCGDKICKDTEICVEDNCVSKDSLCGDKVCKDTEICVEDKCVSKDSLCGDKVCEDTEVCIEDNCVSKDGLCGNKVCEDTEVCVEGSCVPQGGLCGDKVCEDSEVCVNDECISKDSLCGDKICTNTQTCVDDVCIENDKICGDKICTDTQSCVANECVENKQICDEKICEADETCLNDACVPDASICGGILSCDLTSEECVDGTHCEPIDPCRGVTCEIDGQICDNGTCRDRIPCEDVKCDNDKVCAVTVLNPMGECIVTACAVDQNGVMVEKTCGENQMCVNGECTDDGCILEDGSAKKCGDGWQCIKGECEETACIGKLCNEGQACSGGKCIDVECLPIDEHQCEAGEICSKGECIPEACEGVVCKQEKVCMPNGNCEFDSDPVIVSGAMADPTTDETGKTASVEISLNHIPAADVTFSCEIQPKDAMDEAVVDCSGITIDPANWNNPQSITIQGVADHIVDGDQEYTVVITSHSDDPEFDGLKFTTETITNKDVDKAGISSPDASNLMTSEGGKTVEFTLGLSSKPSAPVTITVSSSDTNEGVITSVGGQNGNVITVQPEDWNKPIAIVVTGVDDDEHDPDTTYKVSFEVKSDDPNYNDIAVDDVVITNADNDTPTANFSRSEVNVDETPTTENVSFSLGTKPNADVKVTIAVTLNGDEVTVSTQEITIPKDKWNESYEVAITGVVDNIIDGDQPYEITFTFSSDDPDYNFDKKVTGVNTDKDTASFVLPAAASNVVNESGTTVKMGVQLSSKPSSDVTVTATSSDTGEAKVTSGAITFTPDNWNVIQYVTIAGVDDDYVDGAQNSLITLNVTSSSDANYSGLKQDAWTIITEDNDVAKLIVSKSSISVSENSGKDTFTVKLAAQPEKDNVTVNVASSSTTALTVAPVTLTFTPTNWNTEQTVTATGVNNNIADLNGKRDATISLVSASDDSIFNNLTGAVAATVMDDDTPSINLNIADSMLTQSLTNTTLEVKLSMEPASNVTVTLTPLSPVFSLATTTLTFTPANWNTAQTVKVNTVASAATTAWTYSSIKGTASSSNAYNGKSDSVNIAYKAFESVTGNTTATQDVTKCSEAITLLPGKYKLQAWGASGGDGVAFSQTKGSHAGLGGYAEGILELTAKTTVYMHYGTVGYKGVFGYTKDKAVGGGCNGGGGGSQYSSLTGTYGFGGGGASDIRIGVDDVYHRVLVAGGGGGADNAEGTLNGSDDGSGGYGGGAEAGYGKTNGVNTAKPGTQTTGYAFGKGENSQSDYDLGGGGGGWYGGYAGIVNTNAGGGGGSGYVLTSTSSKPDGYALTSAYYLTSTKLAAGNTSFPAVTSGNETGHQGNGYVKITLME